MNQQDRDAKEKAKASKEAGPRLASGVHHDAGAPASSPSPPLEDGHSTTTPKKKSRQAHNRGGRRTRRNRHEENASESSSSSSSSNSSSEPDVEMLPGAIASGPDGEARILQKARLGTAPPQEEEAPSDSSSRPLHSSTDIPVPTGSQAEAEAEAASQPPAPADTILDSVLQRLNQTNVATASSQVQSHDQQNNNQFDSNPEADLEKNTVDGDDDKPFCTKSKLLIAIGLLIVVVAVAVAIPVATTSSSSSSNNNGSGDGDNTEASSPITPTANLPSSTLRPSPAPSSTPSLAPSSALFGALVDVILQVIPYTDTNIFFDSSTPQYRAIQWMELEMIAIANEAAGASPFVDIQVEPERYIMAVLYYATVGEEWYDLVNFLRPNHICEWGDNLQGARFNGVICNDQLQVTGIQLTDTNLQGTIPFELGYLSHLTSLQLGGNQALAGTIPTEFGQLTQLQILQLRLLDMSGTIPTELANIPTLRQFDVEDCGLEGTIPPNLGPSTLSLLSVQRNNLVGDLNASYCMRQTNLDVRSDCSTSEGGTGPEVICSCCSFCCDDKDVCDFNSNAR